MKVRPLVMGDLPELRRIHERDYPGLDFPFDKDLMGSFLVEIDDEMILAGGLELLAESMLVTDKTKSRIKIGKALIAAQKSSIEICKYFGIHELYACIDRNPSYTKHLVKHGFTERDETILRMIL